MNQCQEQRHFILLGAGVWVNSAKQLKLQTFAEECFNDKAEVLDNLVIVVTFVKAVGLIKIRFV